jgi:predicted site-specific integrase-resolvase
MISKSLTDTGRTLLARPEFEVLEAYSCNNRLTSPTLLSCRTRFSISTVRSTCTPRTRLTLAMPKRTAIYARVSTRDKGQHPETQLIALRDWADRQNVEVTEHVDRASRKILNRPKWKRLTDNWRAGRIDTIAVLRLDLVFRSVVDVHNCLSEWEGRGIRFTSITQPVGTGTPAKNCLQRC